MDWHAWYDMYEWGNARGVLYNVFSLYRHDKRTLRSGRRSYRRTTYSFALLLLMLPGMQSTKKNLRLR